MKNIILLTVICFLGTFCFAEPPDNTSPGPASRAAAAPWSVVGKWQCTNPAWSDTVTISKNGKFSRSNGDGGLWTLAGLRGHVMLVLDWKQWGAQGVTMMGPDDFCGKVSNGVFTMQMHRVRPSKEDSE